MPRSVFVKEAGSPHVLDVAEVGEPDAPGPRQVLIRNRAAGVNFVDTIIRRGVMPPGMMPPLPHVPGVEGAGVVEAIGAGVSTVSVGDRVAWMGPIGAGGYGDYSLVAESCVAKLSAECDFAVAAAMPVNAVTAWHMLVNLGAITSGNTILVRGATGGVGTMIIQLAKHLGATVIALASGGKLDYASAQGADYVIDHTREEVAVRIREITNGNGVDLALNPISGSSLRDDLACLAPLGTVIVFGFLAGLPEGSFSEDLAPHFRKSVAVRLSDIYTYFDGRPWDFRSDLEKVLLLQGQGVLNPQIHELLPLDQAARAHELMEARAVVGKVVLSVG